MKEYCIARDDDGTPLVFRNNEIWKNEKGRWRSGLASLATGERECTELVGEEWKRVQPGRMTGDIMKLQLEFLDEIQACAVCISEPEIKITIGEKELYFCNTCGKGAKIVLQEVKKQLETS